MRNLLDEWSSQRDERMRRKLHEDVYTFESSTAEKRYYEYYRRDFEHKRLQFAELRSILRTTGSPFELIACIGYLADKFEKKKQQYNITSGRYREFQRTLDNICVAAKLSPYPYVKANFIGKMYGPDNRIYKAAKYLLMVQDRKRALRYYDKLMRYVDAASSRAGLNVPVHSQDHNNSSLSLEEQVEGNDKDATKSDGKSESEKNDMEEGEKPRDEDHEGEDCIISDTEDVQKVDS